MGPVGGLQFKGSEQFTGLRTEIHSLVSRNFAMTSIVPADVSVASSGLKHAANQCRFGHLFMIGGGHARSV